ncbi:MAG: hypothetical protein AAF193_00005 [Bacteroidota bacterium]
MAGGRIKSRSLKRNLRIKDTSEGKLFKKEDGTVTFSFKYLHKDWGTNKLEAAECAAVLSAFHSRSSMKWTELVAALRHGLGTEKINPRTLNASLPNNVTEDTTMLAMRFMGKASMVGFRRGSTFFVCYFDPRFELYRH